MSIDMTNELYAHFSDMWFLLDLVKDHRSTTTKLLITGIILIAVAAAVIIIRQQKIIKMLKELKEQDKP